MGEGGSLRHDCVRSRSESPRPPAARVVGRPPGPLAPRPTGAPGRQPRPRLRACPGPAWRPNRHRRLDPYQDSLRLRWQEGCLNGRHLFRELQARGYRGGVSIVAHLVAQWRTALPPVPPHSPVPLTPRAVRWLLVRRPDDPNDEQRAQLNHLLQLPNAGTLVLAHSLIQRFVQMVDDRCPSPLTAWLEEATRCGI